MLDHGTTTLRGAHRTGTAVPAITVYTLESIRAVVTAAERTGLPVMLQAGAGAFRGVGRELLSVAALAAAGSARVPVGVHLDHSTDRDEISACIRLGYTSVMVDGSRLAFEDNVALTASVVEEAHAAGVWVEGEVGALSGAEDESSDASVTALTDPEQAAEFARRTGVDALAVAVGTVHGFTTRPVRIDVPLVRRIAELTPVPLVLHGASGLPDPDLASAVAAGMAKVNINAELRRAHLAELRPALAEGHDDIARIQRRSVEAMTRTAEEKLRLLAGQHSTANERTA